MAKSWQKIVPGTLFLSIALVCFFSIASVAQQKAQFTQYMFEGLMINPAYAGADEALSMSFMLRDQWSGVDGAPSTQTFSAHTLFKKKQIGTGLLVCNDDIGVHSQLNISTSFAYHLPVGEEEVLSFGLRAGLHNNKTDYGALGEFGNDPKLYNATISHTSFAFGTGIYFRGSRWQAGISVPEIVPKKLLFNDSLTVEMNQMNYFLFSKYRLDLNESLGLEPGILIKYLKNVPLSFDINVNLVYRNILTTGVSYRKKESVDLLFKCKVTPQLQVGYAYDHPIGEISALARGSHEIAVNYLFRFKHDQVASPR